MGANTETEWAGRGRGREALKWRANLGARAEVARGAEDGRGVEAGGVFAVAVVAAAVENRGGDAGGGDETEDVFVAGGEVGVGEFHLTEAVVFMRVGAGDPED